MAIQTPTEDNRSYGTSLIQYGIVPVMFSRPIIHPEPRNVMSEWLGVSYPGSVVFTARTIIKTKVSHQIIRITVGTSDHQ